MKEKQWYKAGVKDSFGPYKTIKNAQSGEIALVSKYGEIWEYSTTHYRAVIRNHIIANKHSGSKHKAVKGDETLVTFPKEDLDKWVKILKVKKNRVGMIKLAEAFGRT